MRLLIVVFMMSLLAFIFFGGWAIQTVWLADFFTKEPSSFDAKMGSLLLATGFCFISMIASLTIYLIKRTKLSRKL